MFFLEAVSVRQVPSQGLGLFSELGVRPCPYPHAWAPETRCSLDTWPAAARTPAGDGVPPDTGTGGPRPPAQTRTELATTSHQEAEDGDLVLPA